MSIPYNQREDHYIECLKRSVIDIHNLINATDALYPDQSDFKKTIDAIHGRFQRELQSSIKAFN